MLILLVFILVKVIQIVDFYYETTDFSQRVRKLTAMEIVRTEIEICSYDFFAHQVLTDIDGVLGLDFFKNQKLCIDFKESLITIQ